MDYVVINSKESPEQEKKHNEITSNIWPEFMTHDPVSEANFGNLYTTFSEYQISISINGEVTGLANSIPFYWDQDFENLPEEGWDWALLKGFEDNLGKKEPNTLCGLQIAIDKKHQGKGLSYLIIEEMKSIARKKKYKSLIVPVRPNLKSKYPLTPIDNYITWKNSDGLPLDPWLRVHIKLGGKIIKACHKAMYIPGKIEEWERWTQMKLPERGNYVVSGALVPITVDTAKDIAEYIEPNVWVWHKIA